jgi:hypothetical protein
MRVERGAGSRSASSTPKMTPIVPTITSRAPKEPMSPTSMRQSNPSGRVRGSIACPTPAAMECSMGADESLVVVPGIGTVRSAQRTAETARIMVPTSRRNRVAACQALRATTESWGIRYAGISSTRGSDLPRVALLRKKSDATNPDRIPAK